ncbi:MAG: translation initiation factor IF-3 [Phycisphaerales bacterium JB043]
MARRRYFRDAGPVRRTRVNDMIRLSPIRLIDENNKQVGVVETAEAMRRAREAGLDLVEIKADERPPICKIMDYGKYKYDLSKKEQRSRAASKGSELKEVRLGRSVKIDPHDVEIRVNQARKFLMDGHKVLIVQRFRGREMMHKHLGTERLDEIVKMLADISKVETPPKQSGRQMTLILAPDKPRIESLKARLAREKEVAEQDAPDQTPDEPIEEAVETDPVGEST